ncbi:MAG: MFS transporter, partial [Pseudomonadota bacterium]
PGLWVGSALLGIGFGLRWAALDAWLIAISERAAVGRVIAVAETVAGAAMLAAPLAVRFLPADGLASTAVLLGALAVAGLACFATLDEARGEAAVASPAPRNRLVLAGVALAALAGGAFESGFMTTGPLLAAEAGRLGEALSLAALVGAGSFLLMYPFGWRADRGGAAQVLRVLALAVPAALALLAALPAALLPVAFVLGAAGGGLYTLAIVHGAQHSAPDLMPRVVAIGAGAYTVGSLVSPLMTGWWLDYVGPGSAVPMLAGLAAVAALALCAVLAPGCGEPKLAGSGARTA